MRRALTACVTVALACAVFGAADAHAGKPKLSIADVSLNEPPGLTTAPATFDVTLSKKARKTVKFDYATTGGGTATPADDYEPVIGTGKIKRKKKATTVEVSVFGDSTGEFGNETFNVQLADPKNARIDDGLGTATILDDDCSADADADGKPDCIDECPSVSEPRLPMPGDDLRRQQRSVPNGAGLTLLNAAVTASASNAFWVGVQPGDPEYAGVDDSGIEVDLTGSPIPAPSVGSRVRIEGTLQGDKVDPDEVTVNSTGNGLVAHPVTDATLVTNPSALDGVLVSTGYVFVDSVDGDGDWVLGQGYTLGDRIIGAMPTTGARPPAAYQAQPDLRQVTGIAETSGAGPEVLPRTALDILPGIFSFPGAPCFTLAGGPGQVAVRLSSDAHSNVTVDLQSSDTGVATVPAQATILAGQESVGVNVTPVGVGTTTLTVSYGTGQRTRNQQIANTCP